MNDDDDVDDMKQPEFLYIHKFSKLQFSHRRFHHKFSLRKIRECEESSAKLFIIVYQLSS